jgi:hypothetical protein
MVGKITVVKPLSRVLIPVIKVTEAITMAVVAFEGVAATSRSRNVTPLLRTSLTIVEGRRVLATLLEPVNTACGAWGAAMLESSIDVRDMTLN